MSKPTVPNSETLAAAIKSRRMKLNLTIEAASAKANISSRTWSRYEEGKDIALSNVEKICSALNLKALPSPVPVTYDVSGAKTLREIWEGDDMVWPEMMEDMFGTLCAATFGLGADDIITDIDEDLDELACHPAGTHVGQLGCACTRLMLPDQFLMNYTYDFLYKFRATVKKLLWFWQGEFGDPRPQTPIEELAFYVIFKRGVDLMSDCFISADDDSYNARITEAISRVLKKSNELLEKSIAESDPEKDVDYEDSAEHWRVYCDTVMGKCFNNHLNENEWLHEIFWDGILEDVDVIFDRDCYTPENNPYHFSNWDKSLYKPAPSRKDISIARIPVPGKDAVENVGTAAAETGIPSPGECSQADPTPQFL